MNKLKPSYFRNIIFGAEDSLVSTVGVLFGIATAGTSQAAIMLTGILVISVEALSMGAGAFLSETSEKEFKQEENSEDPKIGGVLMFFSYFIAGFIPLAPYLLLEASVARFASVGGSLAALFVLGFIPQKSFKGAVRMLVVAGMAVAVGFLIAHVFQIEG